MRKSIKSIGTIFIALLNLVSLNNNLLGQNKVENKLGKIYNSIISRYQNIESAPMKVSDYQTTPIRSNGVLNKKSDDSTFNWKSLGPYGGGVGGFFMFPNGDLLAFAASGVYRSNDHGEFWIPYSAPGGGFINKNGIVYCAGSEILFKSTDNGITWQSSGSIPSGASLTCIDSSNNFYAYKNNDGLYRSSNYGATWNHVHGQIGSGIELTGIVVNKNGNLFTLEYSARVYKSTNFGITWDTVAQIPTNSFPMNLVIDTIGYLYVGCYAYDGIFRSTDNGNTWQNFGTGITSPDIWSMYVDNSNRVYAGTSYCGVFRSYDNGISWHRLNLNMTLGVIVDAMIEDKEGYIYAGLEGEGIYRSSLNDPFTWSFKSTGISALDVTAILKEDYYLFIGTSRGGLFRSTNSGLEWEKLPGTSFFMCSDIKRDQTGVLFLGTDYGLYRSTYNGSSGVRDTSLNTFVQSIYIDSSDRIIVGGYPWSPMPGGIFYTDNHISWSKVYDGSTFDFKLINSANKLYAASGSLIYSPNRGLNWFSENPFPTTYYDGVWSITNNSKGTIFVATGGFVFYSTNNGTTWLYSNNGLPNNFGLGGFRDIVIDQFDNIYITAFDRAYPKSGVYYSFDNGNSFLPISNNIAGLPFKLSIFNDTIFLAVLEGGLYDEINIYKKLPQINQLYPRNNSTVLRDSLLFKWNEKPNIQGYQVQMSNDSLFNSIILDTTLINTGHTPHYNVPLGDYYWRIRANSKYGWSQWSAKSKFKVSNTTGISENNDVASRFELVQNYPNPFNPKTTIGFGVPASPNPSEGGALVTLKVYDILGNEVETLINKEMEAGYHSVDFNASYLPSGVYFYQLKSGTFIQTKQMLLLK